MATIFNVFAFLFDCGTDRHIGDLSIRYRRQCLWDAPHPTHTQSSIRVYFKIVGFLNFFNISRIQEFKILNTV